MSTLRFDPSPRAVINPEDYIRRVPGCPATVVTCFAHNLIEYALEKHGGTAVAETKCANGPTPLYRLGDAGVGLTMSLVSAPQAVGQYEELFAMGVERILVFGTCGVLDSRLADCAIIVPNRAVRDEGVSRHYAPESDEIDTNVGTLDLLTGFFARRGIPHTVGKVWTTDAFYRETPDRVAERREQGCVAVEMECAALAALAQFRGKKIAQFLYAADNLDAALWDARSLANHAEMDAKTAIVDLAIEMGKEWETISR